MTLPVGFIGLGDIGEPMAARVLEAGYALHVFNRTPAKAARLVAEGALLADSPLALARACGIVMLCVTDAAAIEDVVFGPQGLAQEEERPVLLVDHSTLGPEATVAISRRLASSTRMTWMDAPVSGGPVGARTGTLAIMAGGSQRDFELASPVMRSFAGNVTRVGDVGAGQAAKICNQMIAFAAAAAVAEAMALARSCGIDPAVLPGALAGGLGDSVLLQKLGPKFADGTHRGNTANAAKDMGIATGLAAAGGLDLPVTRAVAALFADAVAQGDRDSGLAAPLRRLERIQQKEKS